MSVAPIDTKRSASGSSDLPVHLRELNKQQLEAVESLIGPVLIVAGAGTGKTRTLTARMAHLIHLGLARPYEILAVTFTNRAANELRERIISMTGVDRSELSWVGTFHSMSAKILRREAEQVGLTSNFNIVDDDDQLKIVKGLLKSENIDNKKWPARKFAGLIDRWKNDAKLPPNLHAGDRAQFMGKAFDLYSKYQEMLRVSNVADFGDLILHVVKMLSEDSRLLKTYQDRLRFVVVDEYQDTNIAQYQWLRLLTQASRNICCVGDDDQAIYSWRGARPQIMLDFDKHFPDAKIVKLEQNYRSTRHILGAAVGLIQHNAQRHDKSLRTACSDASTDCKVEVRCLPDSLMEAFAVANYIKQETHADREENRRSRSDIAVAARAWSHLAEIEESFVRHEIPYRIIGGFRFYDRKEIRDALGYLKLCHNPSDGVAFERIVNTPARGIGDRSVSTIRALSLSKGISMAEASRQLIDGGGLTRRPASALGRLLDNLGSWSRVLETVNDRTESVDYDHVAADRDGSQESGLEPVPLGEAVGQVVASCGLVEYYRRLGTEDAIGRLDNLEKLVEFAGRHESLGAFLEHVGLMNEEIEDAETEDLGKVTLMTLHAAKGSEYPVMVLIAWEEGQLPWHRAVDEGIGTRSRLAERLAASTAQLCSTQNSEGLATVKQVAVDFQAEQRLEMSSQTERALDLVEMVLGWKGMPGLLEREAALLVCRQILAGEGIEEERRLAHVGITRAKEKCLITHTNRRRRFNQWMDSFPSRFLAELPSNNVESLVAQRSGYANAFTRPTVERPAGAADRSHNVAGSSGVKQAREKLSVGIGRGARARSSGKLKSSIKSSRFSLDERVSHKKLGLGTVRSVSSNRLVIDFDEAGTKLIMADYVRKSEE